MNNMHHFGIMNCLKTIHKKFKITKENKGDKLVITFSGSKDDVAKYDKKLDAMVTLAEDCCCGTDEESCC